MHTTSTGCRAQCLVHILESGRHHFSEKPVFAVMRTPPYKAHYCCRLFKCAGTYFESTPLSIQHLNLLRFSQLFTAAVYIVLM